VQNLEKKFKLNFKHDRILLFDQADQPITAGKYIDPDQYVFLRRLPQQLPDIEVNN